MWYLCKMPYSQILAIIVALSLIVGAQEALPPTMGRGLAIALWSFKLALWYFFCLFWARKTRLPERIVSDRVLWLANLILLLDLYVLNINGFLPRPSFLASSITYMEGVGLSIYFVYVLAGWGAVWKGSPEAVRLYRSLRHFVFGKAKMILPVFIPYFMAGIMGDVLKAIGVPHTEVLFTITFLVAMAVVLPPVTLRIWSCKPLPDTPERKMIEDFLLRMGQKVKEIMLWPAEGLEFCTASVLGILPRFRYILFTPCLLSYLTGPEILAVLSHEITHIKRRHMFWYLAFILAFMVVFYRLIDPAWTWLMTHEGVMRFFFEVQNDALFFGLFAVLPFVLVFILYFRFVMGFFMRNFEREADSSVFETGIHPSNLINALEKVAFLAGGTRNQPSWHHYSVAERVDFLTKALKDRDVLMAFKRRLRNMKGFFLLITAILAILPSFMPKNLWEAKARENLTSVAIDQVLGSGERRPDLYLALGELFLQRKDYEKAEWFTKRAVRLAPNSAQALNNLAWLYATSEDPRYLRPKEALILAKRAAGIDPAPYILDTLAEAYFRNGMVKEAAQLEEEILSQGPERASYYKGQLKRFRKALGRSKEDHRSTTKTKAKKDMDSVNTSQWPFLYFLSWNLD